MIGPIKVIAAAAISITIQDALGSSPAVDRLQESANTLNARFGTKVSMELNGCMKDERNSTAVTCHYRFAKAIPVEVHADAPKGPVTRVIVEYSGGKENAHYISILAQFLADLLIPDVSTRMAVDLQKKIESDFSGVLAGGSAKVGSYDFEYRTSEKATTLKIFSR